jgi:hypothetical protein
MKLLFTLNDQFTISLDLNIRLLMYLFYCNVYVDEFTYTSSSDDSVETLSESDVQDDTINIARQALKCHAIVACTSLVCTMRLLS